MEKKLKHLEFIQGVINRLAANSFLDAAFITVIPVVVFLGLDSYVLWQERLYRASQIDRVVGLWTNGHVEGGAYLG